MLSRRQDSFEWDKWFWDAWDNEPGLKLVSPATEGIWVRILCAMWRQNPRGVISGDVKVLSRILSKSYTAAQLKRAMDELVTHGVCSRGREVAGLDMPEALVCRRMYRKWKTHLAKSEAGRKGGLAGLGAEKPRKGKNSEFPSKFGGSEIAQIANGSRGSSKKNGANGESRDTCGENEIANLKQPSAKPLPYRSLTNVRDQDRSVDLRAGARHPNSLGEILSSLRDVGELNSEGRPMSGGIERIVTRMVAVTGDAGAAQSWRRFAMAFSRDGETFANFLGEICDFEDSLRGPGAGMVRNRGAVLTARLQACAGRLGVGV